MEAWELDLEPDCGARPVRFATLLEATELAQEQDSVVHWLVHWLVVLGWLQTQEEVMTPLVEAVTVGLLVEPATVDRHAEPDGFGKVGTCAGLAASTVTAVAGLAASTGTAVAGLAASTGTAVAGKVGTCAGLAERTVTADVAGTMGSWAGLTCSCRPDK
jgi:hypothetical protein